MNAECSSSKVISSSGLVLVEKMAGILGKHLYVDPGELLGAAWDGYRQAQIKYDPSYGVAFDTYASKRMRGAVLDFWRQRSESRKKNKPKILTNITTDEGETLFDTNLSADPLFKNVEDREVVDRLLAFVNKLERRVLRMYYLDGMLLDGIAERLGCTASNVSRIKTRALGVIIKRVERDATQV